MNRYINAIKRQKSSIKKIAKKYNKPIFLIWLNALWNNICYGVTPNQYISWKFYTKSRLEKNTFYTRRKYLKYESKLNNKKYTHIFNNKQEFNEVFSDFVKREWLYCSSATIEEIEKFIKSHSKIILKPTSLSSGKGICLYTNQTAKELKGNNYLIEEYVIQHPLLNSFNSSSVNTIRIYTILDKAQYVHILSCSLRVGGNNSTTDNFHGGGVGYPIDAETGVLYAPGTNITGEKFIYHTNGKKIVGNIIPNWNELKKFVFDAANKIPQTRLIAWDVAVLEKGFELIEGNCEGDPGFMQSPSNTGKWLEIKKYL